MSPTVLVTGSEGNIGKYVVTSIVRALPEARIIRVSHTIAPDAPVYAGDLRDPSFVQRIFAENAVDIVVHLAAKRYSASAFKREPLEVFDNDLTCLLNVVRESRQVKKFVYASSALVYESSTASPFIEDSTEQIPPPRTPLGMAKCAGERAVRLLTEQYGVPHTIWRPFNVVSPHEPHDGDGHVFVDFYRRLFVEKVPELEIYGSGNQIRSFTWVEDVADALAGHLLDQRTENQTFNIGNDEQITLKELATLMLELGRDKGALSPAYAPELRTGGSFAGTDSEVRVPSLEKIERTLGWKAAADIRACFNAFIDGKLQYEN